MEEIISFYFNHPMNTFISKATHILSVIAGVLGIVAVITGVSMGADTILLGINREHWLFCSMILFLMAIWFGLSAVHHLKLEDKNRII